MGTKKIAVIINGDTEARHKKNVDRALAVLKRDGYETHVLSVEQPKAPVDHFVKTKISSFTELLHHVAEESTADTDLVVYTTGHGAIREGNATLCIDEIDLDGGVSTYFDTSEITDMLDKIPYSRRVVITDQCYGGNWLSRFVDDPRTLFVSAGSNSESTCCAEFAPRFFAAKVPDSNGDGIISWKDRYDYVMKGPVRESAPQWATSEGFRDIPVRLSKGVMQIEDENTLKRAIGSLKPGQHAAVLFSMVGCGPCVTFKPKFEQYAKEDGGANLFIITKDDVTAQKYGVGGFPEVIIFSADGSQLKLKRAESARTALKWINVPPHKQLAQISVLLKDPKTKNRLDGVWLYQNYLTNTGKLLPREALELLDDVRRTFDDADTEVGWGALLAYNIVSEKFKDFLSKDEVARAAPLLREQFANADSFSGEAAIGTYANLVDAIMDDAELKKARDAVEPLRKSKYPWVQGNADELYKKLTGGKLPNGVADTYADEGADTEESEESEKSEE